MSCTARLTSRLDARGCFAAALILVMTAGIVGLTVPVLLTHAPPGASCALQARWGPVVVPVPAGGCNGTARFTVAVPAAGRAFVGALGSASADVAVGLDCTPVLSVDPTGASAASWGAAFELGPEYAGLVPCELVFCSAAGAPAEVNATAIFAVAVSP